MNIHHIGINVESLEESQQFYQKYFGFEREKFLEFQGERILFLESGSCRLELVEGNVGSIVSNGLHIAWKVTNLVEWTNKLTLIGLMPKEGPYSVKENLKIVFYEGPNGEVIELIEAD